MFSFMLMQLSYEAEKCNKLLTKGTRHRPKHSAVDALPLGLRSHLKDVKILRYNWWFNKR